MIKILDCTLRDGGYINNWCFGEENIKTIINNLSESKIDYIECGFLTNIEIFNKDISLFNDCNYIKNIVNKNYYIAHKYALMLNYGDNASKFDKNIEVRLSFKKNEINSACNYAKELLDKGIKVSLNPMHIGLYEEPDFLNLVKMTNIIKPQCITAVDTMGIMKSEDVVRVFSFLDKNIISDISLGFHSHNNLQLSFDNIKTLISMKIHRDIIIDTSLLGIGRGGGMFPTEALAHYLNLNFSYGYNTDLIEKCANNLKHLENNKNKDIYFLTAKYKCHPNYGTYLEKTLGNTKLIENILSNISDTKKMIYDEKYIEEYIHNKY